MNTPGRPISLAGKSVSGKNASQATAAWAEEASLLLKRALRECGWGYQDLAEALKAEGIHKTPAVLNRRINRGNFSAGFLLACLKVMPVRLDLRPEKPASVYTQLIRL